MKKELFKFGVNNSKLKNTITFSKSSGLTCPAANKCRAMAVMNEDGKRSVKRFKVGYLNVRYNNLMKIAVIDVSKDNFQ